MRLRPVFALLCAACATASVGSVQGESRAEWLASTSRMEWLPPGSGLDPKVWKDSLPGQFSHGPTILRMAMLPLPIPQSASGSKVETIFVIDSTGAIERISFNALRDREYTRLLMRAFRDFKFRPATAADGRPTRGFYLVTWDLHVSVR